MVGPIIIFKYCIFIFFCASCTVFNELVSFSIWYLSSPWNVDFILLQANAWNHIFHTWQAKASKSGKLTASPVISIIQHFLNTCLQIQRLPIFLSNYISFGLYLSFAEYVIPMLKNRSMTWSFGIYEIDTLSLVSGSNFIGFSASTW